MSLARTVRKRRGLVVAVLAGAVLTSACGLKPEVKDQLAQSGGAGGGGGTTGGIGGTGGVDGGVGTTGGTGGSTGGFGTTTGGTSGGTTGGTSGGTSGSVGGTGSGGTSGGTTGGTTTGGTTTGGPAAPGDNGTTTGIDFAKKVVHIALHGPLTGAGVPQDSFKTGTPKYWENHKLKNGFTVEAVAIDDKYNAPDALRACNAAAKEYFLIVGGAGTDQIQACAQSPVLRRGNVPYLSAGVTESGLGALPNYFATSLSYKQQGPLVVEMAKKNNYFAGTWGVVITEGPNFADAKQSIIDALKASGAKFDPSKDVYLTDKAPRDCASLGGTIRGKNYGALYFLGQPAFFAQCVKVIGGGPVYTGPGPSFGINTVANLACSAAQPEKYKGFYLHPTSGLDQAAKRAPGVTFKDDIEYDIYASMAGLEYAFNLVQGKLTREKFIAALRNAQIPDLITSGADFRGGARFGGKAAYGLKSSCGGAPATNVYTTTDLYTKQR